LSHWFEVDKEGLAKLLERVRSKGFVVLELIQNSWDADGTTKVRVELTPVPNKATAVLRVEDDAPDGFSDLRHAFTLFAESEKKKDPTKRGRFDVGEKLVLALCRSAKVVTTTGEVRFNADGTRTRGRGKTDKGSIFKAEVKLTRKEVQEADELVSRLLVPEGIKTIYKGEEIPYRMPLKSFEVTLPTELADDDGYLRPTKRKTVVEVHEVKEGETAHLYEMGIPVVETGDRWHINIMQKVPLSLERENVTPSYLRKVRVHVLNNMKEHINQDDATTWARDAVSDKDCEPDAVKRSMDLRFGQKRVVYDPSDPEANSRATASGFTVIHGSQLSGQEWDSVRRSEAALPAGQVTPSPKPYSDDPFASPVEVIDYADQTEDQRKVVAYCERLSRVLLLGKEVEVRIVRLKGFYEAAYGSRCLDLNFNRLGKAFFQEAAKGDVDEVDRLHRLVIHELAHEYESDHLSSRFQEACCKLGARLTRIIMEAAKLKEVPV
jgi:hypothetical protein